MYHHHDRNKNLDRAAYAVHDLMREKNFSHRFFGDYQIHVWTNGAAMARDIEVVIKPQRFGGFMKILNAFQEYPIYKILQAVEAPKDSVDPVHIIKLNYIPTQIPINVYVKKLPSREFYFAPDYDLELDLPFFMPTDHLIWRFKSLIERTDDRDAAIIDWLWRKHRDELDVYRFGKRIQKEEWRIVNQMYSRELPILAQIQRELRERSAYSG